MTNDYQGKSFAGGIAEGFLATASFMPVAGTFGAGDIMGPSVEMLFTERHGLLVPEKSHVRVLSAETKIGIAAVPSGQTSYTLQCYSVPQPSAQNDNDLWSLAAGDLDCYLGSIALGSPLALGSALYVRASAINVELALNTGSIFARLVTDGAHTAAAVARSVQLHCVVI